jgi:hypothetical protein
MRVTLSLLFILHARVLISSVGKPTNANDSPSNVFSHLPDRQSDELDRLVPRRNCSPAAIARPRRKCDGDRNAITFALQHIRHGEHNRERVKNIRMNLDCVIAIAIATHFRINLESCATTFGAINCTRDRASNQIRHCKYIRERVEHIRINLDRAVVIAIATHFCVYLRSRLESHVSL